MTYNQIVDKLQTLLESHPMIKEVRFSSPAEWLFRDNQPVFPSTNFFLVYTKEFTSILQNLFWCQSSCLWVEIVVNTSLAIDLSHSGLIESFSFLVQNFCPSVCEQRTMFNVLSTMMTLSPFFARMTFLV